MYYALIMLSVVMFSGVFGLQDLYRKKRGSGIRITMESTFVGAMAGLIVLLVLSGFSVDFTPFTLLMATVAAINIMALTFCSFRALEYINLSLFSLFAMLGGMALPFFQGILFYNEGITWAKVVCVVLIGVALALTVEKGDKDKGTIYYIGIFVFNGMCGVLSKLFTASPLPKTGEMAYSMWIAAMTVVLSGVFWLVLSGAERRKASSQERKTAKPARKTLFQSYGIAALYGMMDNVANFLLVVALVHVDASVQYPMVTGGTMIVSTVISCFGEKKPSLREIISVALAFLGMVALFAIPA